MTRRLVPISAPEAALLPNELHGAWLDSWSTSMEYSLAANAYDFETQVWFAGKRDLRDMTKERGFGLHLAANGTFLWVRGEYSGLGGRQIFGVHVMKGTVTVDGSSLRFHPTAQRQRYAIEGDPGLNFDRELPNVDFSMPFSIGTSPDSGLATLTLIDEASGARFAYFRQ